MGHSVTIGGERLGSGKKMKAYLHNYERSTHDLSYVWRSTMAAGTLVPFLSTPALPGDTFDIDLNVDVLTHPTIGPLFGTYKIQLDLFQIPIRLYQGKLHMNMLGIGMDMSKVVLPQMQVVGRAIKTNEPIDNQQINPSCILSYLGIRGCGISSTGGYAASVTRYFNAVPYLGYWDIYKNYYANKQEEIGAVIHKDTSIYDPGITLAALLQVHNKSLAGSPVVEYDVPLVPGSPVVYTDILPIEGVSTMRINGTNITETFDPASIYLACREAPGVEPTPQLLSNLFAVWEINPAGNFALGSMPIMKFWYRPFANQSGLSIGYIKAVLQDDTTDEAPKITTFPLENIDTIRREILAHLTDAAFQIDATTINPYGLVFKTAVQSDATTDHSKRHNQEGLALKTYQSDLFNNWISTEWIDGPNGIAEVTAIDTSAGSFTIDELNMSKKVYEMLNRIAISGGSYDDWLDAVYTHERQRSAENPIYQGGLIRNLVFQEVISNSATAEAPLGTLAGRGKVGNRDKGGKAVIKVDEPSYIMGIISLTPNIDYSQGNQWDTNLFTLNDLHKPALDEIGFQDLITDQMAWFDTQVSDVTAAATFRSAGKQPAWLNYMTAVNKVLGNFADENQQMFMVLNRRYDIKYGTSATLTTIKDLTTYIDPSKFNHIFADTRRDAQNFWAQIHVGIQARRKMSAKIMPNL